MEWFGLHGGLSQIDSVNQQGPVGKSMDMGSQLKLPVVDSIDETSDVSDLGAQGADKRMQAGDGDQAARIPDAGAWIQGSSGTEDGGAQHDSALGVALGVTRRLATQVCEGPPHHAEGRGSVMGLGGGGEHTGMAAAVRRCVPGWWTQGVLGHSGT